MMLASVVFLALILVICFSFDLAKVPCNSNFNLDANEQYNLTVTYEIGDCDPQDACFDGNGNLFFIKSYSNSSIPEVCVLEAASNKVHKIEGLPENDTYSIAIDKSDNIVYFGTTNGIYKYNHKKKSADIFLDSELNILHLKKDDNKFVAENIKEIQDTFVVNGDKTIQFESLEAFDDIAVDEANNYYYIKEGQVFLLKATLLSPICIGNITFDGVAQITFYKDYVFIASNKLMYYRANDTDGLKQINNVPGRVTTIAFDNNNHIIIGTHGKLFKYKKVNCVFRERRKDNF